MREWLLWVLGVSSVVAFGLPGLGAAGTVQVSPGQSIQQAVDSAGAGGTTIVHVGTYTQGNIHVPSGSSGTPTTLKAAGDGPVTLRPSDMGVNCIICLPANGQWIVVDGFTLDGGDTGGTRLTNTPVINEDHENPGSTAHIWIQNNDISHARHQGALVGGADFHLLNNRFHDNGTNDSSGGCLDHGVYLSAHDSVIQGNTFDHNLCFGLQNYNSSGHDTSHNTYFQNIFHDNGAGFVAAQGSGHFIYNNVIYNDATKGGVPGAALCCAPGTRFYHNTVANNHVAGLGPYNTNDSSVDIQNNIVCGNAGGDLHAGGASTANNLTGTCPGFVNAGAGNFRLTAEASVPCLSAVTTDATGATRTAPCSAGAFEFSGSTPPPPPPPPPLPPSPPPPSAPPVPTGAFHVATTGSNSNNGSASAPWRDIGYGVSHMGGGQTLVVHGGSYTEDGFRLPSGSSGSPTTLMANPGDTVTIHGAAHGDAFFMNAPGTAWLLIDGFHFLGDYVETYILNNDDYSQNYHHITIQNSELTGSRQSCLLVNGDNYIVQNNHVHHCGATQDHDHNLYFSVHHSLVKNNFIHDAQCFGFQVSNDRAVQMDFDTFDGNTFTNNGCGTGSLIFQGNHTFINNVIYADSLGNSRGVTPGTLVCCEAGTVVLHNTFANNHNAAIGSYNGVNDVKPGVEIRNNIACNNARGDIQLNTPSGNTSDNITGSCPGFVNAGAHDYHLTAAHPVPCLGKVPLDKEGKTRGPVCDAGAFQFSSSPSGDTTPPTIHITVPTADPTVATAKPLLLLGGDAADDVGVTSVTVSCAPSCGTVPVTGTTSWSVSVPLQPGSNVVTVVAHDAAGHATPAQLTVTFTPQVATVGTFYVATTGGDDSRTCLQAQNPATPVQTMARAFPCAAGGSTIWVRAGTYAERIDSVASPITGGKDWTAPTVIAGFPGELVTLVPSGDLPMVNLVKAENAYLVIKGFVFDAKKTAGRAVSVSDAAHHVRIQKCIVQNTVRSSMMIANTHDNEFIGNTVVNSASNGIYIDGTASMNLIKGNIIMGHRESGIATDGTSGGTIIDGNTIRDPATGVVAACLLLKGTGAPGLVMNNAIFNCPLGGITLNAGLRAGHQILNNTLVQNTPTGVSIAAGVPAQTLGNLLLAQNATPIVDSSGLAVFQTNLCDVAGTGCTLVGPPGFVNVGTSDFRLQASSLARDHGTAFPMVATDLMGLARPQPAGGAYDIGAYEFLSLNPGTVQVPLNFHLLPVEP